MTRAHTLFLITLVLAVLLSAVGVVYAKYESRRLFVEFQQVRGQYDRQEMDWGRLQLELATVGALEKVMRVAEGKLRMAPPTPQQIVVVE